MYAYIFVFNYRVYFIFTKFATLPTKKKPMPIYMYNIFQSGNRITHCKS